MPRLQPHAEALSDFVLCEVQLCSFFEVPSLAVTDVQYHFAAVIRVSLIFITMHCTSVSDSVSVCVYVCVFSLVLWKMAGMAEAHSRPRVDLDIWLNMAVTRGRTASGCSSSSPTCRREKLILFAGLFGKAWVSVWVSSI